LPVRKAVRRWVRAVGLSLPKPRAGLRVLPKCGRGREPASLF
jgi:hypothetical protein